MTVIGFTITFHSPFRVGASYARDGVDAALDHDDPLPADHLKGVMRAAAAGLLGRDHQIVMQVFGTPRTPSPWAWSSATPEAGTWDQGRRHRVTIGHQTHAAVKDRLVLGEHAWAPEARFEVTRAGELEPDAEPGHVLILRCAAAAVHGLGAWRRRGLGWVGITPEDGPVDEAEVARLLALAEARA
jgi:hypothetical protein